MMLKWRNVFLLAIAISLIIALPITGMAQGKVTIKPTVTTSWRTDNNFFKAETNKREVYTYIIKPGIEVGYESAKTLATISYSLDIREYDDQDTIRPGWQAADRDDYVGHIGKLDFKTKPTERLILGLEESYMKTRDPGASDKLSTSTDREKFRINRITPQLFYDFGARFTAGLRYRHSDTDYDLATREDSKEKRPMFDLIYNFNKTTSLDLEYQHWNMDYALTTSDYDSDQVKLIFRKQYKYFALVAGGGRQERDFDDPTLNDIDVTTYRVGIIGQNPPLPEAKPRSYLALGMERNFNDAGAGDSYYVANRMTLNAGHVFAKKLPFDFKAFYQTSDYERTFGLTPEGTTVLRDDDSYNVEGKLGYIFNDWFLFSVSAGYEERDSNLAGMDYENRYIMATIDFSYSLGKR
ncbi:MAG: outer membrane beta-barrel protein [Deltaproteobacteria bacterium]|nr:outer membrane beta-barrel protein [Deltaproteobacteria bacterium]